MDNQEIPPLSDQPTSPTRNPITSFKHILESRIFDHSSLPSTERPTWSALKKRRVPSKVVDSIYYLLLFLCSFSVLLIILGIFVELLFGSSRSIQEFGFHFFTENKWDPGNRIFGSLPFILGTLYSSAWALVIAVPISIFTAIFLSEFCPNRLYRPLSFLIELLAAIPSVVYGLWGIFVLQPFLVKWFETPISKSSFFSKIPIFGDTPNGYDMLSASMILAIMIIPYITSVSRDILRTIPKSIRDASYALGATPWQTIRLAVLPYARSGLIGAIILGLGRALGETMAVTMVIGNSPRITWSLFNSGYTMSSVIANELAEASGLYRSALIEIGLSLFVVTLIVNIIAKL
ncbi:MAG TPA: phosphate ABC transporter permease subunit PstC, partial [Candidatus Kapabacteria bacterium]|nr:phosphate ABC transporter permease subunit PstC [Candidatus Kapabacteria bacterium]